MANNQLAEVRDICARAQREYGNSGNFIGKLHQITRMVTSIEVRLERNSISLTSSVIGCLEVAKGLLCMLQREAENTEELIWLEQLETRINNIY